MITLTAASHQVHSTPNLCKTEFLILMPFQQAPATGDGKPRLRNIRVLSFRHTGAYAFQQICILLSEKIM
jgi:hypothetical protein